MGAVAGAAAASSAAAAHHNIAINAVRSWGPVVKIDTDGFLKILRNSEEMESNPLVVMATGGWFSTTYSYLTPYKGLYFYTKSSYPLSLPSQAEVVNVDKIWVPHF
jgi:hypothetical protein